METRSRLRPRKETSAQKPAPAKRSRSTTTAGRGRKRTKQQRQPSPQAASELEAEEAQSQFSPNPLFYSRRNAISHRNPRLLHQPDVVEESSLIEVVQVSQGHESEDDNSSQIRLDPNKMRKAQNQAINAVRLSNLRGLKEASDELVTAVRKHAQNSRSSTLDLDVKRGVLESRFIAYQDDRSLLFIQPSLFEEFADKELEGEDLPVTHILGNANLAAALNLVHRVRVGEDEDLSTSLEKLDDFYDDLFAPFGEESQDLHRAVDLRTSVFINKLGPVTRRKNPYTTLVGVFGESAIATGSLDYEEWFENGPFRPLGKIHGEEGDAICNDRIKEIVQLLDDERKNPGTLAQTYVMEDILQRIEDWIWEVYQANNIEVRDRKAEAERATTAHDIFHDAEEQPGGEDTQSADSQPVVRLEESQPRQSLFQGAQSLKVLHSSSQPVERLEESQPRKSLFQGAQSFEALLNSSRSRSTTIPPSNQQQNSASQTAPVDYDHDNAAILGPPPPSSNAARVGAPSASAKLNSRADGASEDGSDDDDPFEEDSRPAKDRETVITHILGPKQARRPKSAQIMGPPPRPSFPRPTPTSTANPGLSQSEPNSSFQSAPTASLDRSVSGSFPTYKHRQAWSPNDTDLLITLIRTTQARWSKIELENHRFETPRNQQAYRDKARNLKVEYLLYDRVLPPCFNLVALSKKEIDRLISFGKNPYRKEDDLDDDGNPIGTEYARADEF